MEQNKRQKKYVHKIIIFAMISQVPYSLALSVANTRQLDYNESFFIGLAFKAYYLLFLTFVVFFNYYVIKKNNFRLDKYYILLFFLSLINILLIKINGIWVLTDSLNVLNTFVCGLLIIGHYETIKSGNMNIEYLTSIINSAVFILISLFNADYGNYFMGIILILSLYFVYDKKILSCMVVIIWSFVFYVIIFSNLQNFIFSTMSILFIILYNSKKIPYIGNFFIFCILFIFC